MEDRVRKTERLIRLWTMLHNNPTGYTANELANKLGVNIRTIYRYLLDLQCDLKVPLRNEKKRWILDHGQELPPVRFTIPEALNIFLAVRLMLGYNRRYDPNAGNTFSKLASVLPAPLREQVQKTVDWMETLPKDDKYLRTIAQLAEAWIRRTRVKISYRALPANTPGERVIEPYFIEPASSGHSSYVIAFCHKAGAIRTFKVERIEKIESTGESYTIPEDFDANRYFGGAWGIVVEDEEQTIKLKFNPSIARLMEETIWHPSQMLEKQEDGSVIMTLRVFYTYELVNWILGWGEKVEVLEPEELRKEVLQTAKAMVEIYQKK